MNNFVAFAHALADETRLRIVHLVLKEALCVCELADILEMPQSSVSSHVQVIRKAGLLDSEKRGKWVYYRMESRHRKLVQSLDTFFAVSDTLDSVLRADAASSVARLALREQVCCPPPLELATRKPAGALTKY
ncbi:MAG: ArsR/SmtB family transcription factor [Verrucomicrobium sp.]|nr:metalloregulator ArsR/SmtB family transcription factor [Verrucomicrobium sp.]